MLVGRIYKCLINSIVWNRESLIIAVVTIYKYSTNSIGWSRDSLIIAVVTIYNFSDRRNVIWLKIINQLYVSRSQKKGGGVNSPQLFNGKHMEIFVELYQEDTQHNKVIAVSN